MPRLKFWTDERLWELLEMYENPDVSTKEIANHFGKSVQSIRAIAHANEIKRGTYFDEGFIKCYRCKIVLPANAENFSRLKKSKTGYRNICKECEREIKGYTGKRRRKLTESEKQYLIKNYSNPAYTVKDMAEHLGITNSQLIQFVTNLRRKGFDIKYKVNRKEKVTNE